MKYLTDYTGEKTTQLLDDLGVFFAFSNKQLEEQRKEGVEYVTLGAGTVCPKENCQKFIDGMDAIGAAGIAQDLAENGKKGVIQRELGNHEYCITQSIEHTVDALTGYGITDDEIRAETGAYLDAYYKWEAEQEAKAEKEGSE